MTNFLNPQNVCPYTIGISIAEIIEKEDIIKVHYEPISEDATAITCMFTMNAVSFNFYIGTNDKDNLDKAHLYKFTVDNGVVGIEHIPVCPCDLYCKKPEVLYKQKIDEMNPPS